MNIMDWLLEDETPDIKYRTMVELQGRDKNDPEVKKAYDQLLDSEQLHKVLEKFEDKNKWEHINALLALADFGLTREDVAIDDYVEQAIKGLNKGMKCAKTLMLRNLVALGYYEHPWVNEQVHAAFATVREDGTVHCLDQGKKSNDSKLPEMGCYRQTTTYLLLAAELKKKGIVFPEFERMIEFYREHEVMFHKVDANGMTKRKKSTNTKNTDGMTKDEQFIIQDMAGTFFPIDHVHIGLQMILYALSVLGAGDDVSCQKAWEQINDYLGSDGKYRLSDSFDEPYFSVGNVGQENKWVTLYVLLAKKYCGMLDFM